MPSPVARLVFFLIFPLFVVQILSWLIQGIQQVVHNTQASLDSELWFSQRPHLLPFILAWSYKKSGTHTIQENLFIFCVLLQYMIIGWLKKTKYIWVLKHVQTQKMVSAHVRCDCKHKNSHKIAPGPVTKLHSKNKGNLLSPKELIPKNHHICGGNT
jgi:hypothetical protein